ncbi:MAG: hypothetical protein ING69_10805 [Rhodocyclaceae bacterium]|nr:hypothetical protein [Rhodocyclaceae bacterium]
MILQGIIAGSSGGADHERKIALIRAMGEEKRHAIEVAAIRENRDEWRMAYLCDAFRNSFNLAIKNTMIDEQNAFMELVSKLPRVITAEKLLELMPVSNSRLKRREVGTQAVKALMEELIADAKTNEFREQIRVAFAKWESES